MGCILKGSSGLWSRMTVGAVLLAAGSGSRLGNRPKSLLELGGVSLIMRQLVALSGAGIDELVVVLGHHADAIGQAIQAFPIQVVHNPEMVGPRSRDTTTAPHGGTRRPSERPGGRRADDGQASSVRLGLAALSPRLDAVIIALADQPLINAQDITTLISAYKKKPADAAMVVPRVTNAQGVAEPGNPVIFESALAAQWLSGQANAACRQWRLAHPERVHWLETDNRRFRTDIDTPEDIARFSAETGHVLTWPAAWATADAVA